MVIFGTSGSARAQTDSTQKRKSNLQVRANRGQKTNAPCSLGLSVAMVSLAENKASRLMRGVNLSFVERLSQRRLRFSHMDVGNGHDGESRIES